MPIDIGLSQTMASNASRDGLRTVLVDNDPASAGDVIFVRPGGLSTELAPRVFWAPINTRSGSWSNAVLTGTLAGTVGALQDSVNHKLHIFFEGAGGFRGPWYGRYALTRDGSGHITGLTQEVAPVQIAQFASSAQACVAPFEVVDSNGVTRLGVAWSQVSGAAIGIIFTSATDGVAPSSSATWVDATGAAGPSTFGVTSATDTTWAALRLAVGHHWVAPRVGYLRVFVGGTTSKNFKYYTLTPAAGGQWTLPGTSTVVSASGYNGTLHVHESTSTGSIYYTWNDGSGPHTYRIDTADATTDLAAWAGGSGTSGHNVAMVLAPGGFFSLLYFNAANDWRKSDSATVETGYSDGNADNIVAVQAPAVRFKGEVGSATADRSGIAVFTDATAQRYYFVGPPLAAGTSRATSQVGAGMFLTGGHANVGGTSRGTQITGTPAATLGRPAGLAGTSRATTQVGGARFLTGGHANMDGTARATTQTGAAVASTKFVRTPSMTGSSRATTQIGALCKLCTISTFGGASLGGAGAVAVGLSTLATFGGASNGSTAILADLLAVLLFQGRSEGVGSLARADLQTKRAMRGAPVMVRTPSQRMVVAGLPAALARGQRGLAAIASERPAAPRVPGSIKVGQ